MRRPALLVASLFAVSVAGCAESVSEGTGIDDAGGYEDAVKDGSLADGSKIDSGSAVDTGGPAKDSTVPDTAPTDTGTPDTGSSDTGDPDTGDPDTGDFPDFGSTDTGTSTGDGGGSGEIGPFAPGVSACNTDAECGADSCCTKAHTCGVLFAGECVAF